MNKETVIALLEQAAEDLESYAKEWEDNSPPNDRVFNIIEDLEKRATDLRRLVVEIHQGNWLSKVWNLE